MDMLSDLLTELGLQESEIQISSIDYVLKSIEAYEQTINSMGAVQYDIISQAITNSELSYPPLDTENEYANLPEDY